MLNKELAFSPLQSEKGHTENNARKKNQNKPGIKEEPVGTIAGFGSFSINRFSLWAIKSTYIIP